MIITRPSDMQGYVQLPDGTWERKSVEFSVATVGGAALVPVVPHGGLDLEDDTPLPGGAACPLDGSCESCQ